MRKIKAPTTLVRVSKRAQSHFEKVKRNTDMSVREQVDEAITCIEWCLANPHKGIGIGVLKASLNTGDREHKRDKIAMGHTCEIDEKGYCSTCGKKVLAEQPK